MGACPPSLPHQYSQNSASRSVLIVNDVATAAEELRRQHQANQAAIRFHLDQARRAWAEMKYALWAVQYGTDEEIRQLDCIQRERRARIRGSRNG